ncbi:beta-hexosaminidase subunit beta-like isoform X2 [Aricia agestis]|nr:beta-hexosaminidase subunit beta-like isoform X2 [Aricia agestis]
MDESYDLSIILSNSTLKCQSVWGCLRGLETFTQLVYYSDDDNALIIQATHIKDSPRYQHRGLLLDTSRHYITVTNIVRTIDAMAMNKMNVLHWHIVDDQSFPYQSEKFPELSKQGSYHSSMLYTKEDIRKIVEYARDRGIRVVAEFDVPGHTRSWGNAYPKLLVECYKRSQVVGLGPINPINNHTYEFLRELFQEVQNWFPDKYFHIGGDEIILKCWQSNPELQAYMREHGIDAKGLHALFMKRTIPLLADGSKAIVWQEVFDNRVPLDKDTLVQVWKYYWVAEMIKILKKGHKVLFSSSWYLDYLSVKWEELYEADPRQMVADVASDVLVEGIVGGEACMWGEMVDDRNVMSRVWPRTSAVAERLWSKDIERSPGELTHRRLEEHTCRMIRRGIPAEPPSGPGFCVV